MLIDTPHLATILDQELIGFLTAVSQTGQPQTAPVWFVRDDDDIVVYNRPRTPRLGSISVNPKVAFNVRGDRRARGALILEGMATPEAELPQALDFPGYPDKYAREIERLGWTPESFSNDYSAGLRIVVSRVRSWGLEILEG